jgi:LacI family transcriptional regulator
MKKDGVMEKRYLGYKRAMQEANLDCNPSHVFEGSVSYEHGVSSGRAIAETDSKITAVFAASDLMAFGVIKGLMMGGKLVPADVSVIGFDDIWLSEIFIPSLTTVKQDIAGKGALAANHLIKLIEGVEGIEDQEEAADLLPLRVVERETVRDLNRK